MNKPENEKNTIYIESLNIKIKEIVTHDENIRDEIDKIIEELEG